MNLGHEPGALPLWALCERDGVMIRAGLEGVVANSI